MYLTEVTVGHFTLVVYINLLLCYSVRIYPYTKHEKMLLHVKEKGKLVY